MSKRYGRNQRRAHREEITALQSEVRRLHYALAWANDRAKPFDARRRLIDDLAGHLGEQMRPYIEGMIRADETPPPLTFMPERIDYHTGETIIQANFELRRAVRFRT